VDVYPTSSDVTIPSGIIARSFRGWYDAPPMPPNIVAIDKIKNIRGVSGVMQEPPVGEPLLIGDVPPDVRDTEVWRGILRPSMHGAT